MSPILSSSPFNPETSIAPLTDKVLLITGGTAGIGRAAILSFAAHSPSHIIFTGRSQSSADSLLSTLSLEFPAVRATFLPCDLSSLPAVRSLASTVLTLTSRLDFLLLNAGILGLPPALTPSGHELHFGTNHLGHALLANLLLPVLLSTARLPSSPSVRVVWTTSLAYRVAPLDGIKFSTLHTPQTDMGLSVLGLKVGADWLRYGQSKLANLLYARAFAKKYPEIVSVSVHPGVVATGMVGGMTAVQKALVYVTSWIGMTKPAEGSWGIQWAATAKQGSKEGEVESGRYYEPVGKRGKLAGKGKDEALEEELWTWTQRELGIEKGGN